ncbi:hypothetical protein QQF64_026337 [Cirrhinus molitorella]|uniref:Uncharacterized protein n=1 Tax=Cirrhinus molitorella TaxID=172907 RepID=A0ABR3N9A0_9TELE
MWFIALAWNQESHFYAACALKIISLRSQPPASSSAPPTRTIDPQRSVFRGMRLRHKESEREREQSYSLFHYSPEDEAASRSGNEEADGNDGTFPQREPGQSIINQKRADAPHLSETHRPSRT